MGTKWAIAGLAVIAIVLFAVRRRSSTSAGGPGPAVQGSWPPATGGEQQQRT